MSTTIKSTSMRAMILAAIVLGLLAAPAAAAPELDLSLTNSPTSLPRSDERMTYEATVSNVAPSTPQVGDALTCNGIEPQKNWFPNSPNPEPTFTFTWVRNGTPIGGATAQTYTTTASDAGAALQCLVTGTNVNATATFASLPAVVVAPVPAVAVPNPSPGGELVAASRPAITGTGTNPRTCAAPTNWSPATFQYQWLINGAPIPGATSSAYTPVAADTGKNLQCEVVGTSAGGATLGISNNSAVGTVPQPPNLGVGGTPAVETANSTSGAVGLELTSVSGQESLIYEAGGSGWTCSKQQPTSAASGKVACTSTQVVKPGASYPPVDVVVSLGADAPDPVGVATAIASGGGAVNTANDDATYTFTPGTPFGILSESFEAKVLDDGGNSYNVAGGHPFAAFTTFGFNVHRNVRDEVRPTEGIRDTVVDAPRGFVGNALAPSELCGSIEEVLLAQCPPRSVVGGIDIFTTINDAPPFNLYPDHVQPVFANSLIYAIEPEFGEPAEFAFGAGGEGIKRVPYTFVPELRADEGYAISFRTAPIITAPPLWGAKVTLCNLGAKVAGAGETAKFDGCRSSSDPEAASHPLITNPTRCSGPPPTSTLRIDSWQHPADVKTASFAAEPITDCENVKFEPTAELTPTNRQADSPTGLDVAFEVPIDGVLDPDGISQANLDTVAVTFPKGMSINPAAAAGLEACSLAQIKLKSNAPDECPESSKVGTIEIDTPLIRKTLTGNVYVAKQNDNPFQSTLGLYMSFASARDGVRIKVAGKLVTDPQTGQLTSVFTENPEAPFSSLSLHFNQGPRSPLVNPPKCGTYAIHSEFSPWSAVNPANPTAAEIVSRDSSYEVTSGPDGSPCPTGDLEPRLSAGLKDPRAGAKSPFVLTLTREDGSQRFTGLDVSTPKGLTAYLKGIPYCPDATLAGIPAAEETGRGELANPSCPAASQVGTVLTGAGSGPFPFQAPGRVYLAGPYKGAPLSLAVVAPAVAGPFDLGNVVIRNALHVDPVTAQVSAVSDPIPTILHGILLDVRQIRIALDRPGFTAAPTSCDPMSVAAKVSGQDGGSATVSDRFQVGSCEALGFKPRLRMRLFGGTKRGAHPRLQATLTPRPGDANIAFASVALPHSEFLDQAHIRTVCTRVQFAARQCPPGSIYGEAEATTPLLDQPLRGPVYLRSSDNPLPDLVAALRGPDSQPIEVHLDGRIDSVHGGIRSTFEAVPDQPVTKFVLKMQGGKKGLLVNSRNICRSVSRATAKYTAQNGHAYSARPVLRNSCKKAAHRQKKRGGHHGRR